MPPPGRWRTGLSRERLYLFGPAALLTAAAFAVAYHFVEPAPPRRFTLATGRADGAYHRFGLHYRALLAREGITVELRPTSGALENVRLLADPASGVDAAFVQGGIRGAGDGAGLASLASLYFEPLWVFSRSPGIGPDLAALRGRRLAVGPDGSGTRVLSLLLLEANGVTPAIARLSPLAGLDAVRALGRGEVDAAFIVAGAGSETVRAASRVPGARLLSFPRADAYTGRFPFLSKVVLPRGALDLEADVPPRDTVLLAPAASLVVRPGFHPALSDLLLMTAGAIHGGPGLFQRAGQFPSAGHVDLPLSDDARRFHRNGPPLLARYLPFWTATFVDRVKVLLLPLVALMIPLARIVPPIYRWRVRARIYRWYRDLERVDLALAAGASPAGLAGELDRIEGEVRQLAVPLGYRESVYHLRVHLDLIRDKARAAAGGGS